MPNQGSILWGISIFCAYFQYVNIETSLLHFCVFLYLKRWGIFEIILRYTKLVKHRAVVAQFVQNGVKDCGRLTIGCYL